MVLQIFEKVRGVFSRPPVDFQPTSWEDDTILTRVRKEALGKWELAQDLNELYQQLKPYKTRYGAVRVSVDSETARELAATLDKQNFSRGIDRITGMRLLIDGRTVGVRWHNTPVESYFAFMTLNNGREGREIVRYRCGDAQVSFKYVYGAISHNVKQILPHRPL
jgi:hypothetical protein